MNKLCFGSIILFLIVICGCEKEKYPQGKIIYETLCLNCHMQDGTGLGALYPALNSSLYLSDRKAELPCLIKYGSKSEHLSTIYMPAHPQIEEASMTNLVNYLTSTWGDKIPVKLKTVMDQMETCAR